jgi:hypothetical protein
MVYNKGGDQNKINVHQMSDKFMVSRNIAELYIKTVPYMCEATRLGYKKSDNEEKDDNKARENWNRQKAIYYFSDLVMISYHLPSVQEIIKEFNQSEDTADHVSFNNGFELWTRILKSEARNTLSEDLGKWFLEYSRILVKAKLINQYDEENAESERWID